MLAPSNFSMLKNFVQTHVHEMVQNSFNESK